jgi:hypothetical protein
MSLKGYKTIFKTPMIAHRHVVLSLAHKTSKNLFWRFSADDKNKNIAPKTSLETYINPKISKNVENV